MKTHIKNVHGEQRKLTCSVCSKTFKQREYLVEHTRNVHMGIQSSFKCNMCDKTFSKKGNLNGHIKAIHEAVKAHKCNHCNAAFSRKGELTRHTRAIHLKLRPFKCDVCEDKTFAHHNQLKRHMLSCHSKVKEGSGSIFVEKLHENKADVPTEIGQLKHELHDPINIKLM